MLPKTAKIFSVAVLVVAMCGVALSAHAGQIEKRWFVVLPAIQAPTYTPSDTKSKYKVAGWIEVDYIDSGYKVNAQMCSLGGGYCGGGTKVHDLHSGSQANLPNSYAAGTKLVTSLTASSFTLDQITTNGYWCAY